MAREGYGTLSMTDWISVTPDQDVAKKYAMESFRGNGTVMELYVDPFQCFFDDDIDEPEYEVYDPSLIKLADPVIYDRNGNIVSLSERFNYGFSIDSFSNVKIYKLSNESFDNNESIFHGSLTKSIEKLKPRMEQGDFNEPHAGLIWFSDSKPYAKGYASDYSPQGDSLGVSGEIYERQIDSSKLRLWEISNKELNYYIEHSANGDPKEFVKRLKDNGYDGVELTDQNIDQGLLDKDAIESHKVIGLIADPNG